MGAMRGGLNQESLAANNCKNEIVYLYERVYTPFIFIIEDVWDVLFFLNRTTNLGNSIYANL